MILFSGLTAILTMPPQMNRYNPVTDAIACSTEFYCWHEKRHQLDRNYRFVSTTKEFKSVIQSYLETCDLYDLHNTYCGYIAMFPGILIPKVKCEYCTIFDTAYYGGWGGYSELYAELYALADGTIENLPLELQQFYEN
jgi:hypothetical protein